MNLDELSGKSLLLLGKSRALAQDEFEAQLQQHNITLTRDYDEHVAVIAEGRLMNPIEQELHDELYANRAAPIVSVDEVEKLLCRAIDGERLLMSLKLGNDQERLLGFLQNRLIDDTLFLRLFKLFNWHGEGLFENDENRDATAALIERFYENIERNHNVQYANTGLMHLLNQSDNPELVETIATLEPLQFALKKGCDNSTYKILLAIASHCASSKTVLKQFVKYGDTPLRTLVAQRGDIDAQMQQKLYALDESEVTAALAQNPLLSSELSVLLLQDEAYRDTVARSIMLDETRFAQISEASVQAVAANETLTAAMQLELFEHADDDTLIVLAANAALDGDLAKMLYEKKNTAAHCALAANSATPSALLELLYEEVSCHEALAKNEQTPADVLQRLGSSSDIAVLTALAKNPATPVELLYQLQLDKRLERYVMGNEGFGRHIQRDNIGWQL